MKGYKDDAYLLPVTAVALDDDPGLLVMTGETLLWGYSCQNAEAAVTYIQFHDAAALLGVTLGTTVPTSFIALSASKTSTVIFNRPIRFSLGLVAFSTTTSTGLTGAVTNSTFFIG